MILARVATKLLHETNQSVMLQIHRVQSKQINTNIKGLSRQTAPVFNESLTSLTTIPQIDTSVRLFNTRRFTPKSRDVVYCHALNI